MANPSNKMALKTIAVVLMTLCIMGVFLTFCFAEKETLVDRALDQFERTTSKLDAAISTSAPEPTAEEILFPKDPGPLHQREPAVLEAKNVTAQKEDLDDTGREVHWQSYKDC